MLEIYSQDINVSSISSIPFNNSVVAKGMTAVQTAPGTIQFNKKGVYMVDFSGSMTPATTGTISVQLAKNGALQPGARTIATAATGVTTPLAFTSLVQVSQDNNPCCCSTSPTVAQLINTGVAGTYSIARAVVTKIC